MPADFSYTANAHPAYIEALYHDYQQNPDAVDASWRNFFAGFDFATQSTNGSSVATPSADAVGGTAATNITKEFQVYALIDAYRRRGHLIADTNPIRPRKDRQPRLALADFGLTDNDLDTPFAAGSAIAMPAATLRNIIGTLRNVYTGHIGFEIEGIENQERREWLRTRIEALATHKAVNEYGLKFEQKIRIMEKLNSAVDFERFLHKKYIGQKRFSLEGGETTIAALDALINRAAETGTEEVVIGMAHRGRLNVLANTLGKTRQQIFSEFEGKAIPDQTMGSGDVKYHLGYSSQVEAANGKPVYLKLMPNPSHLEAVNPVVGGYARAKMDVVYGNDVDKVLPVLIHGDAAVAGQGIVYEVLQMCRLEGYQTGGTVHFVINNQIGFTTDFEDARSSAYCTSVAATVQSPVFHVNGDDPEAVVFAMELAAEYRRTVRDDVFVDMVCYRLWGHNEGDEPRFTQPLLYALIANHENPRDVYARALQAKGEMAAERVRAMDEELNARMETEWENIREEPLPYKLQEQELAWRTLQRVVTDADFETSPVTGFNRAALEAALAHLQTVPASFTPLQGINRLLKNLSKAIAEDKLDWGTGELLAYCSLLLEGKNVRLSGEDVKRGTFSHRHAVLFDATTNAQYNRINTLPNATGAMHIYNSLLSEYAVMGFEYGYSLATPDSLVIWEGQFGDFYNGAQIIVDQFLTSGETKWQRRSGLVLLLPHGFEGQGPEHSSARLERWLQSAAENNMSVVNVTTPANYFHLLRRQLVRPFRKPLVVMSPKSLLRHPLCVSPLAAFTEGSFAEVIDDAKFTTAAKAKKVRRVVLCTGKIYYDLLAGQTENVADDVAVVRLEQLYPFPAKQLSAVLARYPKASVMWTQEEPENMGAASFIRLTLRLDIELNTRPAAASPASGYAKVHAAQQAAIVAKAFK